MFFNSFNILSEKSVMTVLTVYDVEYKYIAFTCSMPLSCQLFQMGGEIYILNSEGILSKLLEKPLSAKLKLLISKNYFEVAIGSVFVIFLLGC